MSRIGQARDHYWARGIWYEGNMTEVLRLQVRRGRDKGGIQLRLVRDTFTVQVQGVGLGRPEVLRLKVMAVGCQGRGDAHCSETKSWGGGGGGG